MPPRLLVAWQWHRLSCAQCSSGVRAVSSHCPRRVIPQPIVIPGEPERLLRRRRGTYRSAFPSSNMWHHPKTHDRPHRTHRRLAHSPRNRRRRRCCARLVAPLCLLCSRHHVRVHRDGTLQQNAPRPRAHDSLVFPKASSHRLHHRRSGTPRRRRPPASALPLARGNLPHPPAHRHVHRQRERVAKKRHAPRQTRHSPLAPYPHANLFHRPPLVVHPSVMMATRSSSWRNIVLT